MGFCNSENSLLRAHINSVIIVSYHKIELSKIMPNNKELLTVYVDAIKLLHANDSILVRDAEFKIVYMSGKRMVAMGVQNINDVLNCRLQELPQLATKVDTLDILNQIDAIISKQAVSEFIVSDPDLFVNTKMFNLTYRQLLDPNQDDVIGYAEFVSAIGLEHRVKLLYDMLDINTAPAGHGSKGAVLEGQVGKLKAIGLTDRECEILFLLCLRFSGREIAEIISKKLAVAVTASTIGNIIRQQLFRKFEVYNIDELIRKAINLGYWNMPSNYCTHRLINLSHLVG